MTRTEWRKQERRLSRTDRQCDEARYPVAIIEHPGETVWIEVVMKWGRYRVAGRGFNAAVERLRHGRWRPEKKKALDVLEALKLGVLK